MVSNVVRLADKRKGKDDPPGNNNDKPGNRFSRIAKSSSNVGIRAAMLRGEIEESPWAYDMNKIETMKENVKKSKLPDSEKEKLLAYIKLGEKRGTRGAVHRAGEIVRLYFEMSGIFANDTVIKGETELMDAYANGKMEELAKNVLRKLWKKTDEVSRLWVEAVNTALKVEIPEHNPSRRESALFYILKGYYYTTYPNATNYPEEELVKKIKTSIETLSAW